MNLKRRILKTILLLWIPVFASSQNYIPFPDSGGVWKETYWWQPSPFFYNGIGDTYIEGDTVFNDTVYHKIYNLRRDVFCSDIIISGPDYDGALREDTVNQRIYVRWDANSSEALIYDYTLQVGDTLPYEMGWLHHFQYFGLYIDEIDTITTFDSVNRRVWHLDYEEPFDGWPQIIEGIGSTSGLMGGIEPYWEGWNELLCFSVNNEVVWRSLRDTCYVITDSCATVGINEKLVRKIDIKAYPNPANDFVTFEYSLPFTAESATITITNVTGIQITTLQVNSSLEEIVWNTHTVSSGIYFYSLKVNGKTVNKGKLIISK